MFLTPIGLERITTEIKQLQADMETTRLAISAAREKGDLSENEEFHAAKRKHNKITDTLLSLSDIKENSQIINPEEIKSEKVQFGAKVTIQNINTNKETTYIILDTYESDPNNNIISIHSPLAKAMLNLKIGSFFSVTIYNQLTDFEIIKIEYKAI
ncbi:MAG: GreA/GreB family elongation factor [Pseudomonadota bacterium]